MNHRPRTRSTLFLALLLSSATLSVPALHAASAVPFKLAEKVLIILPVTVDGEGPFNFVLDTGADTTVVDAAVAAKLALPALQSGNLTTIAGIQPVRVSRLENLSIGDVQVNRLPVIEADLAALHRIDRNIAGIVGQDVLSHFNYLLDYHARSIQFEQDGDLRNEIDGDPVPIEAGDGNQMLLAADLEFRGHAHLRLLLDSGTNTLVLLGSVSTSLHCDTGQEGTQLSSTRSTSAHFGQVDLTVASHRFPNLPVALATEVPSDPNDDGLLPMSLFQTIYVNNHQSFVVLNPRAKKR